MGVRTLIYKAEGMWGKSNSKPAVEKKRKGLPILAAQHCEK